MHVFEVLRPIDSYLVFNSSLLDKLLSYVYCCVAIVGR